MTNASKSSVSAKHPTKERLEMLRAYMNEQAVEAFIQPMNDRFQSEYTPACAQRIPWMTGFDGSAGTFLITANRAILFVDGRYNIQAQQQVDTSLIEVIDSGKTSPTQWMQTHLSNSTLSFDPDLHSIAQVRAWAAAELSYKPHTNVIDAVWEDRPPPPCAEVTRKAVSLAGRSTQEKIDSLCAQFDKDVEACFIAMPDAVNWLLNIRGSDVDYNPLLLCQALLWRTGKVELFVLEGQREGLQKLLGEEIDLAISSLAMRDSHLAALSATTSIQLDPSQSAHAVAEALSGKVIKQSPDLVTYMKAVKNEVEIEGMREAHRVDGRALSQFLVWLKAELKQTAVTELEASDKLETFRRAHKDYLQPSFTTISGAGPNGAIVHYRVTPQSDRAIEKDSLYLVDSGGQYPYGTTDVTRTIVHGTPSAEMKRRYTQVLKGHIAIDSAIFPEGTTGAELDILARQYLWADGVDYAHGTGHGVGHHLCVHEGPQGISRRADKVALVPGMVLSNEPGYYKEGEYGIRIENLVVVVTKGKMESGRALYGFESLTLVPLEETLVDWELLSEAEKEWWEHYHKRVEKES